MFVLIAGLVLSGCATDDVIAQPTPSPSATPTENPASPLPTPDPVEAFLLHRYLPDMPDTWGPPVLLPYGPGDDQLGTYLGGDGEGIQVGPSSVAAAGDGTWWVLDTAKARFAHFAGDGSFLDDVAIPDAFKQNGHVQWQRARALADGTIVAFRFAGNGTTVLRLGDGAFSQVQLDRQVTIHTDDGHLLYGFGEDNVLLAVDPSGASTTEVDAFRSQADVAYRLTREDNALRFELPGRDVDSTWPLVAAGTGAPADGAIAIVTTTDGRFHLYIDGYAVDEEGTGTGRAGFAVLDPEGQLTAPTEPTRDPWGESDPGSGYRLVGRPGSDDVWLVAYDPDGLRLYPRA